MQRFAAFPVVLFLVTGIPVALADDDSGSKKPLDRNYNLEEDAPPVIDPAKPYVLDFQNYRLAPDILKKTSVKALLKYGWKIETNEPNRLVGSYLSKGKIYKTEVLVSGTTVTIGFVPGFHDSSRKWLRSLANTVKDEARMQRREVEAQRYLNQ